VSNGGEGSNESGIDWERLARGTAHSMQVSILEVFDLGSGRRLSPKDLSVELQADLSHINYHVTVLRTVDLIKPAGRRQVRGAVEHFYELA
jgi:hypothetical protein